MGEGEKGYFIGNINHEDVISVTRARVRLNAVSVNTVKERIVTCSSNFYFPSHSFLCMPSLVLQPNV